MPVLLRAFYLLLAMATSPVFAQAPAYVGLIEKLGGQVKLTSPAGGSFQPAAFSRIRQGDEFNLAQGAEMQIVFFDSRKRESWQGPARLRIGAAGSELLAGKSAISSELKGVPSRVTLAAAGNVQRIGGLTLRSVPGKVPDDVAVAQARAAYEEWVKEADPDDILPELYMIGFLQERRDPELLLPYVQTMQRKQPERADVRAIAERIDQQARPR